MSDVRSVAVPGGDLAVEVLAGDTDPVLAIRLDPEVPVADATDTILGPSWWWELDRPTRLVHAQWSTGRDSPPACPPERVAGFAAQLTALQATELVEGVEHAASIMSRRGAAVVAGHLLGVLRPSAG